MLEPTPVKKREIHVSQEDQRVGHADRDNYIERLKNAVSTGHLTDEEFEERSSEALHAVTKKDLMVLVADIPEMPRNSSGEYVTVRYQVATGTNGAVPFSPWRWGITLFISLTMIILSGPLFAAIFHGLDNAPYAGGLPVMLIIFGAFLFILGGVCFCPGESEQKYKKYSN